MKTYLVECTPVIPTDPDYGKKITRRISAVDEHWAHIAVAVGLERVLSVTEDKTDAKD